MARRLIGEDPLLEIIPLSIANDAQIISMSKAISPEIQAVAFDIKKVLILMRLEELSSELLDVLAWQYHVDIYESDGPPIEQKRSLVKNAILTHKYKGTRWAIRQVLKDIGFERVDITEWWQMEEPGAPYTFTVELFPLTEGKTRFAERCIREYKNVRSHLAGIISRFHIGPEELDAREQSLMNQHFTLTDNYPWPEMVYDGKYAYANPTDELAPRYGIYGRAEALLPAIQNLFAETVWAQIRYGDDELAYDSTNRYGTDAVVNEELHEVRMIVMREIVHPTERHHQVIRWIL